MPSEHLCKRKSAKKTTGKCQQQFISTFMVVTKPLPFFLTPLVLKVTGGHLRMSTFVQKTELCLGETSKEFGGGRIDLHKVFFRECEADKTDVCRFKEVKV